MLLYFSHFIGSRDSHEGLRTAKRTHRRDSGCLFPFLSNMECVNLLFQGRPVSQIQLATARVAVSLISNMQCVNLLGQGRSVRRISLATARVLSPSYQIWNTLTFLGRVGRLAKYNWLQPV
ncbi:hypothetical protein CEXT_226071 [Caerostris extrusa]|uniref:Uncharacterized protein n=1 Tax=Caerostris extrusa TaxID=172846 RepID=A0AAV4Y016_CAEEX|nr:hypothetical protein CEXT_226071 [Caerostris extrusa]